MILLSLCVTAEPARLAAAQAASGASEDAALEELLHLHHEQRIAHVLGDARLFTAPLAAGFVEVGRGRINSPAPAAARDRFAAYFNAVRFLEWEDIRPPRIRISPGGAWAEVLVEKRVRTIPADTTRSKQQGYAAFAWVERWARIAGAWRLTTIASTDRPIDDTIAVTLADRVLAYEILRRAREALGGEAAVARIATMRFSAECEGPNGSFVTEVASARDGRVRFEQRFPTRPTFAAGISLDGPWRRSGDDPVADSVGVVLGSVMAAHELHLLAIAPEARYTAPAARPPQIFDGRAVRVVDLADPLGGRARFFYDAATGLPSGFQLNNHTGRGPTEIVTRFGGWRRVGEVLLPFNVTITQGSDVYRYGINEASVEWLAELSFHPG